MRRSPIPSLLTLVMSAILLNLGPSVGGAAPEPVDFDFNGDGFADAAVGVPNEDIGRGPIMDAGAMQILYGSAAGFDGTDQFLHQNSPGVADAAEPNDQFGFASGIGDFNGDHVADLAIGAPGEHVRGAPDAGAVNVAYGSLEGLTNMGQFFTEAGIGLDPSEEGDRFGAAFGTGDLNGDGFEDLAVGAPGEDVGKKAPDGGAVTILYGSSLGLTIPGAQHVTEGDLTVSDGTEAGDHFGEAFAPYEPNFNADAFDDLAIGAPDEDLGGLVDAGAVAVLYGTRAGPDPTTNQFWDQRSTEELEIGDRFGASIAACDFDGDLADEMAVGAPGEDVGDLSDAGGVSVLRGSGKKGGLTTLGAQFFTQDSPGIAGASEPGDRFGFDLAAGNLDGDGFHDLAVGAPGEEIALIPETGAVNVLYGSAGGLNGDRDQLLHQNTPGIADRAEDSDRFGSSLAIGDFDGSGADDLAVGVPYEDVGTMIIDAGAANMIFGVVGIGLTTEGNQFLHQNSRRILDRAERFDCWACDALP